MKKNNLTETTLCKTFNRKGFTLMETVIAIVILAILLSGFLAVFTPAAQGIKRAISTQQIDNLTSTLQRDLVTLRTNEQLATGQAITPGKYATGFDKAFSWIKESNQVTNSNIIIIYQYRGSVSSVRTDGTPTPIKSMTGKPGIDYKIQSIARRIQSPVDPFLADDLTAIDGSVFYVKLTQLVSPPPTGTMKLGTPGQIKNPRTEVITATAADYTDDAVIAFSAEFFTTSSKSANYLNSSNFKTKFDSKNKPIFARNLAVRR